MPAGLELKINQTRLSQEHVVNIRLFSLLSCPALSLLSFPSQVFLHLFNLPPLSATFPPLTVDGWLLIVAVQTGGAGTRFREPVTENPVLSTWKVTPHGHHLDAQEGASSTGDHSRYFKSTHESTKAKYKNLF